MRRAAICFVLLATLASVGCWRPYYKNRYAQPAYPQAPAYTPAPQAYSQPQPIQSQPAFQPAPIVTQAPVMQQAPVVQGYAPNCCQPCPQPCVPCY
jgi:hypothetical protein